MKKEIFGYFHSAVLKSEKVKKKKLGTLHWLLQMLDKIEGVFKIIFEHWAIP